MRGMGKEEEKTGLRTVLGLTNDRDKTMVNYTKIILVKGWNLRKRTN